LVTFFGQKLRQKSAKLAKMRNKKPLSEYQKQRLGAAMEALQNPIFSTTSKRSPYKVIFFVTGCFCRYILYPAKFN